jgi:hypothetical protein
MRGRLIGIGALLTLLGALTIEVSILLLCTGLPPAGLAWAVVVGMLLVLAGASLLLFSRLNRID